jgi:hypothetical protein
MLQKLIAILFWQRVVNVYFARFNAVAPHGYQVIPGKPQN